MNKLEKAIETVKAAKDGMVAYGNRISLVVYSIQDELSERNACKKFVTETGMSKASISKMLYAETTRRKLSIDNMVSYATIYKLKDIMCEHVAEMLNDGMTIQEIRNSLTCDTDTEIETENTEVDNSETDTEEYIDIDIASENAERDAKDIREQILSILSDYDIEKDDLKAIKSLLKSLR